MTHMLHTTFNKVKVIHFIGIGGIGMSGLAYMFHRLGFSIQGSDIKNGTNIQNLQKNKEVKIFIGHNKNNIENADIIVISSAIKKDNVEYMEAIQQGIPVFKRSKMLSELMRFKISIAIAGTHGKTTTTSLVSHILQYNKMDPTAIIGGIVNNNTSQGPSIYGQSDWIVAETDESDGSFVDLPATIAILTNIEPEHMDYYDSYEDLQQYFIRFINNIPFYGFSVVCMDDNGVKDILPNIKQNNVITYGLSQQCDYKAFNITYTKNGMEFDINCKYGNKEYVIEKVYIPMLGIHNVLNSLAAFAVADNINIKASNIKKALGTFGGVKRRFTEIANINNIKFIDDYAHHPSEIQAVLHSARKYLNFIYGSVEESQIAVIMQPHKYSRLKTHFDDFCKSFDEANYLFLLDVFPAGEQQEDYPKYNSKKLLEGITEYGHKNTTYISNAIDDIVNELKLLINTSNIKMVLFIGAGDITSISQQVVDKIKNQ